MLRTETTPCSLVFPFSGKETSQFLFPCPDAKHGTEVFPYQMWGWSVAIIVQLLVIYFFLGAS